MSAPANTVPTKSGRRGMLQRHRDARPRLARRAAAHRIDHDHHGPLLVQGRVDIIRRAQFRTPTLVSSARIGAMNGSG